MSKLPTQLKWEDFVSAMKNLGYEQMKSKGGSARQFRRKSDDFIATVHEPHGKSTIKQGTLTMYIRNMQITREQFEAALYEKPSLAAVEEERFRRAHENDGTIVSLCNECFATVIKSKDTNEVENAEAEHSCS